MAAQINTSDLLDYSLFRDMQEDRIAAAGKIMKLKRENEGTCIWKEGDHGREFFLLLEGTVEITQQLTMFTTPGEMESKDKSLIRLTADMKPVIGEIALCANVPRSASVYVRSREALLGFFVPEDLEKLVAADPAFGYLLYRNLASIISQRLISANQNVMKLTTAFSLALQRGT